MLERQSDFECAISSAEISDEGTTIHAVTNMDDYGKVRFSITLVSSGERDGGECFGSGRGAMKDGTFFSGSFELFRAGEEIISISLRFAPWGYNGGNLLI